MTTPNIWPIYDELEELQTCQTVIYELLIPDAEPNRERLAWLLRRLQKQNEAALKQLHDALAMPAPTTCCQ